MDFAGLTIGILAYFVVITVVLFLLQSYGLNHTRILNLVAACGAGHFCGGLAFHWFTISFGSDSYFYFINARTDFDGLGYHFAFLVMGLLRNLVVGDSLLGIFLIFSSIAFLGSIFYLLTFKILLDRLCNGKVYYLIDDNILYVPALLLLCWPSYFFWNVGLKDNFAFIAISIFLFAIVQKQLSMPIIGAVLLSGIFGVLIRPYLIILIGFALIFYILFGSRWSLFIKIGIIILIAYAASLILPQLEGYGRIASSGIEGFSQYAIQQQRYMNIGTSIPLPTENPKLLFLFLPYLFFINLFLPLFFGATNLIGMVSSIENIFFLGWVIFFIRNFSIWKEVANKLKIAKFFLQFFLVGMAFLSLMNTNLGLAMREKIMFVPAFLMLIFLVYAQRRILILENIILSNKEIIKDDILCAE